MDVNTLHEKALLKLISKGDEKAFHAIFNQYKDRFYAAALKMTHSPNMAEEIVQEVFLTLWVRRTSLAEIENPTSYLFTIVYHTISAHFKKLASERNLKIKMSAQQVQSENSTERILFEKENNQWLQKVLQQLPIHQRQVYKLSKQEGLSRQEIAEQLGISPHTVKNHLLKAMNFLRMHWDKALLIVSWWLL